MAQAKPSAPSTMEALRTRYVQRLAARRGELHAFAAAFTAGRDIDDEELRYLAHNLAGSGATYGFPEISTLAGDLEDLLAVPETGANWETKADLIWRLVEAKLLKNFFVYLFVCGFFGAGVAAAVSGLSTGGVLWLDGVYSWSKITHEYVQYLPLIMFPEGLMNGIIMTGMLVFLSGPVAASMAAVNLI